MPPVVDAKSSMANKTPRKTPRKTPKKPVMTPAKEEKENEVEPEQTVKQKTTKRKSERIMSTGSVKPAQKETDEEMEVDEGKPEAGDGPSPKKTRRSKAKFAISTEPDLAVDQEETTETSGQTEGEGKKTMSAQKKKSLKQKEKKRKERLNKLKSTMPKEKLEEFLNPKAPEIPPKQAALDYLRLWKSSRDTWKFNKLRQTWLLKNCYKDDVSDEDFAILLEYMQPLKGMSRKETVRHATEMLEKHKDSKEAVSKMVTKRATEVLQMLD